MVVIFFAKVEKEEENQFVFRELSCLHLIAL